jgi:hypothetical protein
LAANSKTTECLRGHTEISIEAQIGQIADGKSLKSSLSEEEISSMATAVL